MCAQYFNRELSWLSFNQRVLDQARGDKYPLLERVKFLAYVSINLDEFFEVRVGGLIHQIRNENHKISPDGLSPTEQLALIRKKTEQLLADQQTIWLNEVQPLIIKAGIIIKRHEELDKNQLSLLENYYEMHIHPLLTPLAIDPAHPFPQFTNKATHILFSLEAAKKYGTEEQLLAVIAIPSMLPRILELGEGGSRFYFFISDLLHLFSHKLFTGYTILGSWAFRVTRYTDWFLDEEQVDNLLQDIEEELVHQKRGKPVRLEIQEGVPSHILEEFKTYLHLDDSMIYFTKGPLNLGRLIQLYDKVDSPEYKFKPLTPFVPEELSLPEKIFESIAREDFLLQHPYHSYTPILNFIAQAAKDPQVRAIKQTLYRTSADSPVIEALKEASYAGKEVTVIVELKARFDEANNIHWARQLEEAGATVVYGLVGYKTHAKLCLVIREEHGDLKSYVHLGTGNYNHRTARAYSDISLFTSHSSIVAEVAELFNLLTGFAKGSVFKTLWISPFNLHEHVIKLIEAEKENALAGKPAYLFAKMNSLMDCKVIDALAEASQAGVKIDLIIRGICGLIPGVKGYSENISVRSLLGRYLEHSRILYALNTGGEPQVYVGSADWMPRNFFKRIECVFPIINESLRSKLIDEWIRVYLQDDTDMMQLLPDGTYTHLPNKLGISAQSEFIKRVIPFPS
jgi:polyphosphate kinase